MPWNFSLYRAGRGPPRYSRSQEMERGGLRCGLQVKKGFRRNEWIRNYAPHVDWKLPANTVTLGSKL